MKKICGFLILLCCWSCENAPRVDEDNIPKLISSICFVPSSYYGSSYQDFANLREIETLQGTSGRFIAEIQINGSRVPNDYTSDYVKNFIWRIEDKSYITSSLSYAFPDTGVFPVILQTIDYFDDTLSDTLTLYVTTPISVSPISPVNGFNQFNALDSSGMIFEVKTDSVASWQNVQCSLYLSMEKNALWDFPYDSIPCNGTYQIKGPFFVGDSNYLADTSFAFFWGVVAKVPDSDYTFDADTSEIQTFYTALVGTEFSHILVPVRYRSLSPGQSPAGKAILQKENGDTIAIHTFSQNPATIQFSDISIEGNLQITVFDSLLWEYSPVQKSFAISPSTYNILDTLTLLDTIPPICAPIHRRIAKSDSLVFSLFDAGSGVSSKSILVRLSGDTLSRTVRKDVLQFFPTCDNECDLFISLRDYAGNLSVPILWKIESLGDSLFLSGPFNPEEL